MSDPLVTTLVFPRPVEAPPRLARIFGGAAAVAAVFDVCFWGRNDEPGSSVAVFCTVLAAAILLNRPAASLRGRGGIILALFAGSVFAAALETGFSNTMTLLALIVALAGETFFPAATSLWGRWISQVIALLRAPGRLLWLFLVVAGKTSQSRGGFQGVLLGGIGVLIPSVLLVLVFGGLLATGNAVFGAWTHDVFDRIWKELTFDLNPWRLLLGLFVATGALSLLRPAAVSSRWWGWTEQLPRLPHLLPSRAAVLSSVLVLIAMNGLFLVANIADALFLWSGRALPAGVTYSGFVHEGINVLTFTTLLSASVLAFIFQQPPLVARRRELKILGGLWIGQNLFLLLGVGERLRCYIEAYHMTIERLGAIIFLVLVAGGYGLLAFKIVRDKSLSWLLGGTLLACFATFYVTQFLNLGGWAADYNERLWENNPGRKLDVAYLHELGPAAWPALARAERLGGTVTWKDEYARYGVDLTPREEENHHPRTQLDSISWREFSGRAWLNRAALGNDAGKK